MHWVAGDGAMALLSFVDLAAGFAIAVIPR
jgi:hypothetical protein